MRIIGSHEVNPGVLAPVLVEFFTSIPVAR